MNKIHISQVEIILMLKDIIQKLKIDDYRPDFIVGLNRGGLPLAVMMSHYFKVPCIPIQASLRDYNKWDVLIEINNDKKYLIMDDICDSGDTLFKLSKTYSQENIKYAVLIHNIKSKFNPDYRSKEIDRSKDLSWMVYPWEEWFI